MEVAKTAALTGLLILFVSAIHESASAVDEFSGGKCVEDANCGNCVAGTYVISGQRWCYVAKGSSPQSIGKECLDSSSGSNQCNAGALTDPAVQCTMDRWDCGPMNGDGVCGVVACVCSGVPEESGGTHTTSEDCT
jgi:hypothetical protein